MVVLLEGGLTVTCWVEARGVAGRRSRLRLRLEWWSLTVVAPLEGGLTGWAAARGVAGLAAAGTKGRQNGGGDGTL